VYGVVAAVQGAGALLGGVGALYQDSIATLAAVVAGTQVVAALLLLSVVLRAARTVPDR